MHLCFCSVAPERNRFRTYRIGEQGNLFGPPELVITWGRMGCRQSKRVERFESEQDLGRRKRELLSRRRRNGYVLLQAGAVEAGQ